MVTAEKEVMFICDKWPQQSMNVVQTNVMVDKFGNSVPIPGKEVHFSGGILKTSDPQVIEHIRNHVEFKAGTITEWQGEGEPQVKPIHAETRPVHAGVISTAKNDIKVGINAPMPVDVAPEAASVQFPRKRGRPIGS